ncbi:MAG: class I SAM-dependent RNA methyltransferase [Pseudomonadota bacterium]
MKLDIFVVCPPGLESQMVSELADLGFVHEDVEPGGVTVQGDWADVWRANLWLRGATRILVRLGSFRAMHLAQLDKRARRFPWADHIGRDVTVKVEATCRKSRIYHAGAARTRVETALQEELGARIAEDAPLRISVRILDDLCTISLDTSGELLHRRRLREKTHKAPLRESLAALFLRQAGYTGSEPVIDPMCGAGTFPLEAAEIAMGLAPGRNRSFSFEALPSFDPAVWATLKTYQPKTIPYIFRGFDRDQGAVALAASNARKSGTEGATEFKCQPISELAPPEGPPGLVISNPPYGARIGNKKPLFALYGSFGQVIKERFKGWRAAIVTSDAGLARATGLDFLPPGPPVAHGGLKVHLYQTKIL